MAVAASSVLSEVLLLGEIYSSPVKAYESADVNNPPSAVQEEKSCIVLGCRDNYVYCLALLPGDVMKS